MLTPIPTTVPDAKDAVLWSIYDRLQRIDENAGTRINFATTIAYNAHVGLNDPVFDSELDQIRTLLKIEKPKADINEATSTSRGFEEPTAAMTMRDDL